MQLCCATNLLGSGNSLLALKRPKLVASRRLAMKTHRSEGGECCVFTINAHITRVHKRP